MYFAALFKTTLDQTTRTSVKTLRLWPTNSPRPPSDDKLLVVALLS